MSDHTAVPSYVRTPSAGFLASLPVDRPLVRYDLAGSVAHVEMLGRAGLLNPKEVQALVQGLRTIGREVAEGHFPWREELEDVHTNVESRLTEIVGPVGGKLHTARSRNDQVAVDERLYLRAAVRSIARLLLQLAQAVIARARQEKGTVMPGYTHLQRAQPVTLGHWWLAYFWRFDRDVDRLFATAARANVSPLGAGALAGSTLPIDPQFVAQRLGFDRAFENSMDAVSDRDYLVELLFDLSLLSVHASALGEELVLFASKEFGYLERTPVMGSGSSLMPQKRNPDVAELVRGKTGRVVGDLVALLTTLKGLPLTYDRDLQEDKAPVLDAVNTLAETIAALGILVPQLEFNADRLRTASEDAELYATDFVEGLVKEGVPFRAAHEVVGAAYGPSGQPDAAALTSKLSAATDPTPWTDPARAVERRRSPGAPGSGPFDAQLRSAEARLQARLASLSSLDRQVERIEELLSEEPR
jgi:argininosuccinate lyase